MSPDDGRIADRAWGLARALRDAGLSYLGYVEQITFLLFLKLADERDRTRPGRRPLVPAPHDWPNLLRREGDDLVAHYRRTLAALGDRPGLLGLVFHQARPDLRDPALLARLVRDLIGRRTWTDPAADTPGDVYEGLLARSAAESARGAGQYFTPRPLVQAIVECVRPTAADRVCDPACGTGGFLLAAREYVLRDRSAGRDARRRGDSLSRFAAGWELVPDVARLCAMNLYLHGADADPSPVTLGDGLTAGPARAFSLVLTNPPFGRTTGGAAPSGPGPVTQDEGTRGRPSAAVRTKQFQFLRHVLTLLTPGGRCAMVVPDGVLFEGGAGEQVRRTLLETCDVHTLLRLPTGVFYADRVRANVLFFDRAPPRPGAARLWVYDLRTGTHVTRKGNPLTRGDLDEFVTGYRPEDRRAREPTWDPRRNPGGRWRAFEHADLMGRHRASLDLTWLADGRAGPHGSLPEPAVLAGEIADDLRAALKQISAITGKLKG